VQVQIRGATSILAPAIRFVIDGVIVSDASIRRPHRDRPLGRFDVVEPGQTVTAWPTLSERHREHRVLKSAAAAHLRLRATNGVVVIRQKGRRAPRASASHSAWHAEHGQEPELAALRLLRRYGNVRLQSSAKQWAGGAATGGLGRRSELHAGLQWYVGKKDLYGVSDPRTRPCSQLGRLGQHALLLRLNDKQSKASSSHRCAAHVGSTQPRSNNRRQAHRERGIDVTHNFIQDGIGGNDTPASARRTRWVRAGDL